MSKELILGSLIGTGNSKLTYAEKVNAFLGNSYTSTAGNQYFNAMRFADGIVIKEDIGQGYKYAFLNGLRIYSLIDKTLIIEETYHCQIYSLDWVKERIKEMLKKVLSEAARARRITYDLAEADRLIQRLIEDAFRNDQRIIMDQQLKRLVG